VEHLGPFFVLIRRVLAGILVPDSLHIARVVMIPGFSLPYSSPDY